MRKICLLLLLTLLILPCAYAKNNDDDAVFLDAKESSINLKPEQDPDSIKNVSDIKVNAAKSNEKYLLKNKVEVPMGPYDDPLNVIDPDYSMPIDPVRELIDYGAKIRF